MEYMQKWLFLLFIVLHWENRNIYVLSLVNGTLTCPAVWKDQDNATLTCEVLASSVNSTACPGASGKLLFNIVIGATPNPDCFIPSYLDAACNGTSYDKGCRCKEKTINDTYILEYTLTVRAARHMGVSWECAPLCEDTVNVQIPSVIYNVGNCTNVVIVTTTTAPLTTVVTTTVIKSTSSEVTTLSDSTTTKENSTQGNSTCHDDITCEKWKIVIIVVLPILFIIAVIIGVLGCKWKKFLCFENKAVDPTRSSNERHQNDLRSGRQNASFVSGPPKNGALPKSENPDASSALAPPDQSSLKKSKTTDSEKTGSHHVASEKSPPKEHSIRKETALDLTELNSGSTTSEESASNIVTHRQLRPLPTPNLTSVERNSSVDPFRQTNPLPEISARLKQ